MAFLTLQKFNIYLCNKNKQTKTRVLDHRDFKIEVLNTFLWTFDISNCFFST